MLYLFNKPRNEDLSRVPVWKGFYEDLFLNYPPRIILQALTNIIKPELKSRRNKESVAENLFEKFGNVFKFDYGQLDMLMSTKQDVLNRKERVQFKPYKHQMEILLQDNSGEFDFGHLGKQMSYC